MVRVRATRKSDGCMATMATSTMMTATRPIRVVLIMMRLSSRMLPAADADLAEALDRVARTEVLELKELTDLDLALLAVARGVGKALAEGEGLLARLRLDNGVPGDQLLRLGERPVDDRTLVAVVSDAPALGARLQAGGVEERARSGELLVERRHLGDESLLGHDAGLRVLAGLDDDHEPHWCVSCRIG